MVYQKLAFFLADNFCLSFVHRPRNFIQNTPGKWWPAELETIYVDWHLLTDQLIDFLLISSSRLKDVVAVLKMGEVVLESVPQLLTQWINIQYVSLVTFLSFFANLINQQSSIFPLFGICAGWSVRQADRERKRHWVTNRDTLGGVNMDKYFWSNHWYQWV